MERGDRGMKEEVWEGKLMLKATWKRCGTFQNIYICERNLNAVIKQ